MSPSDAYHFNRRAVQFMCRAVSFDAGFYRQWTFLAENCQKILTLALSTLPKTFFHLLKQKSYLCFAMPTALPREAAESHL